MLDGVEDELQFARDLGGKDVAAARARAGHAALLQLAAQLGDMCVLRQQHGQIARLQRHLADAVRAGQQRHDVVGAGLQGGVHAVVLVRRRFGAKMQHQRPRQRPAVHGERRDVGAGAHRLVDDVLRELRERLSGGGMEGIEPGDELAGGTVVDRQPQPAVGAARGLQIGVDVAAAETVDGLLGIADHHQPAAPGAVRVAVDGIEDRVLARVGVLELVHQRHRPGAKERIGERVARRERLAHAVDQAVETDLVALAQARLAAGEQSLAVAFQRRAARRQLRVGEQGGGLAREGEQRIVFGGRDQGRLELGFQRCR